VSVAAERRGRARGWRSRPRAAQQHAFEGDGAQDAAMEARDCVGERRAGGEEARDGGEAAPEAALRQQGGEMAAVGGEDAHEQEDFGDALGHGLAGLVLWGLIRWGTLAVDEADGGGRGNHGLFQYPNMARIARKIFATTIQGNIASRSTEYR
jgi:hypothetical protein